MEGYGLGRLVDRCCCTLFFCIFFGMGLLIIIYSRFLVEVGQAMDPMLDCISVYLGPHGTQKVSENNRKHTSFPSLFCWWFNAPKIQICFSISGGGLFQMRLFHIQNRYQDVEIYLREVSNTISIILHDLVFLRKLLICSCCFPLPQGKVSAI